HQISCRNRSITQTTRRTTMNTILDDAETRSTSAVGTAQTLQQERVDAMRQEIGPALLDQAKRELPQLEHFIAKEIRPFLARVSSTGQHAKQPLPQYVQDYAKEMFTLCDTVPTTIRAGITAWGALTPPIWTDGKSLDVNARTVMIQYLRFCL